MIAAWHYDARMTVLGARLNTAELVAAVFSLEPRTLLPGDSVKTIALLEGFRRRRSNEFGNTTQGG